MPNPPQNAARSKSSHLRAYLCLFTAVAVWGVEYPMMKHCSSTVGSLPTGAGMFSVAAILLWLTMLRRQRRGEAKSTRAPPYLLLITIGLLGFGVNVLGLWGIELTSLPNSSTLSRSDALFVLLLSAFVFREPVARWAFLFVPLMLAGVCLLTGILTPPLRMGNPGDYLMLASALCLSLNGFAIKRAVQHASVITVGLVNSAITAALFISLTLTTRGIGGTAAAFGAVWLPLLALGTLACLFYITHNTALRTLPVWEVRLMCLLVPVIASLVGWATLKEKPTPTHWLGMALITGGAAGIILSARLGKRREATEVEGRG